MNQSSKIAAPRQPNFEYAFATGGFSNQEFEAAANVISSQNFDPENSFEHGFKRKSVIGPQDTLDIEQAIAGIPITAFKGIKSGDVFQVVTGTIHYDDIFPDTPHHRTMYCFIIRVNRDKWGNVVPSASRCPRWNCADEECKAQENEK